MALFVVQRQLLRSLGQVSTSQRGDASRVVCAVRSIF